MKIAICLYGYVGTYEKYGQATVSPLLSHKFFEQNILNTNREHTIDVFIHSWSHEQESLLIDSYHPTASIFEPQIDFSTLFMGLKYKNQIIQRYFALFSKWYSVQKVLNLMIDHHRNSPYDIVLLNRFDLCWKIPVNLNIFDSSKIYCGYLDSKIKGISKLDDAYVIGGVDSIIVIQNIYNNMCEILNDNIKRYQRQYRYFIQSPHHSLYRIFELHGLIKNIVYYFKPYEDYTTVRFLNSVSASAQSIPVSPNNETEQQRGIRIKAEVRDRHARLKKIGAK